MLEKAAQLHQQTHDQSAEGSDLLRLALIYRELKQVENAEKVLNRALELHQLGKDVLGEANDLFGLAEVYLRQGKLDESERACERAIEKHRLSQDLLGEGIDLVAWGRVWMARGDMQKAKSDMKEGMGLIERAQDHFWLEWGRQCLSELEEKKTPMSHDSLQVQNKLS